MNKAMLIGRWIKDTELKFTPDKGTAVLTGTLAVDKFENGEKKADLINVVIWSKQAESTAEYCGAKGNLIAISGRIQSRSYDAKDGSKRYVTEVVASEVQFLSKGNQASNETAGDTGFDGMTPDDSSEIPF